MKPKPATEASIKWEKQPLDWTRASGQADRLMAAIDVRKKRQRLRRIAVVGASATALCLAGIFWHSSRTQPTSLDHSLVATSKAVVTSPERRTLPDGSVIELKPGAEIALNFTANFRRVELTRGEVLFEVTKNVNRPFIVTAGNVSFRAVGTAFSVGLGNRSVEMLVTEGVVAVERPENEKNIPATGEQASPSASLVAPTLVTAGNRVVVEIAEPAPPAIMPTTTEETGRRLAWRIPRLEFNDTPLWEVVSLLNQHSGSHIILANSELGRVEISGALRADNIEPLLQTLEANYHIQVVRRADGGIELRKQLP